MMHILIEKAVIMSVYRLLIIVQLMIGIFITANGQILQRYPDRINRSNGSERSIRSSRDQVKAYDRAETAANIFNNIMDGSSERIFPQAVLNIAQAIAIFPAHLKYGAIKGDRGGGLVSTRDAQTGLWQPPIFINLRGDNVNQYLSEGNDLILFALNHDAMRAFFSDKFKIAHVLSSLELLGQSREDLSNHFDFIAYQYNQASLSIINIEHSTIVHNSALNFAIYGERKIRAFLPMARPISNRVLVFPATLNHYRNKEESKK